MAAVIVCLAVPTGVGAIKEFHPATPLAGEAQSKGLAASSGTTDKCQPPLGVSASARNSSSSETPKKAYLGQVATRSQTPNSISRGSQVALSLTYHDTRDDVTALKLAFANWYADPRQAAVESGAGGPMTVNAKIEYPAGSFHDVLFSGALSGIAPDGETLISDFVSLEIPKNTRFKVHVRRAWASGGRAIYNGAWADNPRDALLLGPGADRVRLGESFETNAPGYAAPPAAILGMTTRNSMLILGDSIEYGHGDTYDQTGFKGYVARAVGAGMGYINAARGSESSREFMIGHARRAGLSAFVTHVFVGYDTNDLGASYAPAEAEARLEAVAGMFPGKVVMTATIPPRTSAANVPFKNEPDRLSLNRWKRSPESPFDIVWEYADQVETVHNSGQWRDGYHVDGVHPSPAGHSVAIPDMFLVRPRVSCPEAD